METNELTIHLGRMKSGVCDIFLNSAFGDASGVFQMPFTPEELCFINSPRWLWALHSAPGVLSPEQAGTRLFEAVFNDRFYAIYSTWRALQRNGGLVVKIKFNPEKRSSDDQYGFDTLYQLPWELLYDPTAQYFLGRKKGWAVVRHMAIPHAAKETVVQPPPFRILVVLASPPDYEELEPDTYYENVFEGLSPNIQITRLDNASWQSLGEAVSNAETNNQPFHAIHFYMHGDYYNGRGLLIASNEGNTTQSEELQASKLADLLGDQQNIQYIFLASCMTGVIEGANNYNPYLGVATALVNKGFPNVIAMSREIHKDSLTSFSKGFYEAKDQGKPLSDAVTMGRNKVFLLNQTNEEWATPMLFSRITDEGLPKIHWPFFKKLWTAVGMVLAYFTIGYICLSQADGLDASFPLLNYHRHAAALIGLPCCAILYWIFAFMSMYYAKNTEATSWYARIPEFWNATWNFAHPSAKYYQIGITILFLAIPTYGQYFFAYRFFTGKDIYLKDDDIKIDFDSWKDHFNSDLFAEYGKDKEFRYDDEKVTYYPINQPIIYLFIVSLSLLLFLGAVYSIWIKPTHDFFAKKRRNE